jgi:hypothetical protein
MAKVVALMELTICRFDAPPIAFAYRWQKNAGWESSQFYTRHWVIGGANTVRRPGSSENFYRGDSLIYTAAIHAGVIENSRGGCGDLTLLGERSLYSSTEQNGIINIGFDSSFPMSFTVKPIDGLDDTCADIRWIGLFMSAAFKFVLSLSFISPGVFYFSTFTVVFFQVALFSDAPDFEDYLSVVEMALQFQPFHYQ